MVDRRTHWQLSPRGEIDLRFDKMYALGSSRGNEPMGWTPVLKEHLKSAYVKIITAESRLAGSAPDSCQVLELGCLGYWSSSTGARSHWGGWQHSSLSVLKAGCFGNPNLAANPGRFLKRHWFLVNRGSVEILVPLSVRDSAGTGWISSAARAKAKTQPSFCCVLCGCGCCCCVLI